MENYQQYSQFIRPQWAPPSWLFGPVWSFLYILIAVSYFHVAKLYFQKQITFMVMLPFLLNLVFNLIFTPIQFGLKNNYLATIDILLVLITLVWALIRIYPYAKWVTYINIPYLLWVIFATVLQITITVMSR